MQRAPSGAVAAALLAACGGSSSSNTPSEGTSLGTLTVDAPIGVSADGSDVYVLSAERANSSVTSPVSVAATRFRGSQVDTFALAADWSDFGQNLAVSLQPAKISTVQGGIAYFLGAYGVTVVPIAGGDSQIFEESQAENYELVTFGVGGGFVYACDFDIETNTSHFGRFDAQGSWQLLYTSTLPGEETCSYGAVAVDTDAVYWSTNRAIRAYDIADGSIRTVVNLQTPDDPPWLLAISGDSLVWFDLLDTGFHAVAKTALTDDSSAALGASTIARINPNDPAPFSMVATATDVYWLSSFALHRVPTAGGDDEILAETALPNRYVGLAAVDGKLYFAEDSRLDDGGVGTATLRTRPQ